MTTIIELKIFDKTFPKVLLDTNKLKTLPSYPFGHIKLAKFITGIIEMIFATKLDIIEKNTINLLFKLNNIHKLKIHANKKEHIRHPENSY